MVILRTTVLNTQELHSLEWLQFVGYQPTLSTEMGSFQERIVATIFSLVFGIAY